MYRVNSFLGLILMMLLAWLLSSDRRRMDFRLILSGVGLQILFGVFIMKTSVGLKIFDVARAVISRLISFSDDGAQFVFGEQFREHYFAFSVLPTIIFVSSLMAILFHLGIMQHVVSFMARVMVKVMDASGSESLAAAANVFIGQTEAPLVVKPYLLTMTRSELMALMTGGMATVAGGVLAAYAGMGADPGHLLTASVMSAPASLVLAKIIVPETEESNTRGYVRIQVPKQDSNVLDAACRGASEGLMLALNVAAMLIAFIALVGAFNWLCTLLPDIGGAPLTLQRVFSWMMAPFALMMGVEWQDAGIAGTLLGEKTVLNEFVAYVDLIKWRDQVSPRTFTLMTYALCGFANFSSVAIQIGGIGSLVPSRRRDFAKLGLKAMVAGSLAAFMTACIAGMLL
ncbi:MAG TPA: nucleoside transporter C-terminal domain-containing protein [Kiritimatiellia bacterium]|nr:nucleoside transporter C-terminal domain-containing protein [Kiritimatiellia bacterium]HNS81116.1 nucleoside transporter C-terminal domain-containing protein [Kiritimatiellia bacterium]HPA77240.1 nucleoside transporter C-terminal domain-containing protein [Kiritimatiellia bacterium]HQQ03272.1 nucleoside transporter C-terminal domain-containing protein [Kiritimatiellia bacterium]